MKRKLRSAYVGVLAAVAATVAAGFTVFAPAASSTTVPMEHVSTTGTDAGNCVSSPCATINYAISQAKPGQTISVAAGTYNQTVDVTKPVTISGAGAASTIIDGSGLDPSSDGYYGVVYFGNVGGVATFKGFTVTNPYPDSYTGGEPEAIALKDTNAGDFVNILSNTITEGSADSNTATDAPIGIDTFLNAATTTITNNSISGFFQAALLEDNGPATLTGNKVSSEISLTDNSTDPATVYPAEGISFIADDGATHTDQVAKQNSFTGYSGYGIAEDAGYGAGYPGSLETTLTGNILALTGGSQAAGVSMDAIGSGNSLTGQVNGTHGYVTAPSTGIEVQSEAVGSDTGAGTVDITENNDNVTVKAASASTATSARGVRYGRLHVPKHPGALRHH